MMRLFGKVFILVSRNHNFSPFFLLKISSIFGESILPQLKVFFFAQNPLLRLFHLSLVFGENGGGVLRFNPG